MVMGLLLMLSLSAGCGQGSAPGEAAEKSKVEEAAPTGEAKQEWHSLFDGETLEGWEITQFGGQGRVMVRNEAIILEYGNNLTGITWKGDLPKENYEATVEAQIVEGSDFFCGLTFPVGESSCTFIVGGWGGSVIGLSSIDGADASENETFDTMGFKKGRWYKVRVAVTEEAVSAYIDDDLKARVERAGRRFGVRPEVLLSRPFGISSWQTTAALRDIKIRRLDSSPNE